MRRGLASMLMGLSLMLASLGWAGILLSSALLDPSNAPQLMSNLLNGEAVRSVLVERVGDGMERLPPDDEPMSQGEILSAAGAALDDPLARRALGRGLTDAYQKGLNGEEPETGFSHFDVNEAARLALLDERPSLEGRILVNPLVRVRLPVEGLSWLAGMKSTVDRFAILAIAIAIAGFGFTFVVADEPPAVLRRAAWWVLATAAFWIALGALYTAAVRMGAPSSYIVLASALEHFLLSLRTPATVLASFGIGMLSISFLVPAVGRRRGALLLERAQSKFDGLTALGLITSASGSTGEAVHEHATTTADRHLSNEVQSTDVGASASTTSSSPVSSPVSSPSSTTTTTSPAAPSEARETDMSRRLSAAWLEGHGYLDDARIAPFFSGSSSDR